MDRCSRRGTKNVRLGPRGADAAAAVRVGRGGTDAAAVVQKRTIKGIIPRSAGLLLLFCFSVKLEGH